MNEQVKFEDGQIVRHRLTKDEVLVLHHAAAGENGGFIYESVVCRTKDYEQRTFRPYELAAIKVRETLRPPLPAPSEGGV